MDSEQTVIAAINRYRVEEGYYIRRALCYRRSDCGLYDLGALENGELESVIFDVEEKEGE